jgi:hypothetical protein
MHLRIGQVRLALSPAVASVSSSKRLTIFSA